MQEARSAASRPYVVDFYILASEAGDRKTKANGGGAESSWLK
jgi:hypothetical protein